MSRSSPRRLQHPVGDQTSRTPTGDRRQPLRRLGHGRRGLGLREVEPRISQRSPKIRRDLVIRARVDDDRDVRVGPAPRQADELAPDGERGQEHEQHRQEDRQRVPSSDRDEHGPRAPLSVRAQGKRQNPDDRRRDDDPDEHQEPDDPLGDDSLGGTRTRRKAPTSGTMSPTSITIQMTDPNVIPRSRIWRDAGTRPKRRVEAQPSVVVKTFPANLEPKAVNAARNATSRGCGLSGYSK